MITFWVPRDVNFSFPCNHTFTDNEGIQFSFTVEHCGCILPQTGAPGEPPRHETKGEHWRRVGEHLNPSYKNRLTVGRGMGSPIPGREEGAWTREGPKVVE